MSTFDPKAVIPDDLKRFWNSARKYENSRLESLRLEFEWAKEIDDSERKFNKIKEVKENLETTIQEKIREWKLYQYDEATGNFYDMEEISLDELDNYQANHKIENIYEYTKDMPEGHYEWAFKRYSEYMDFVTDVYYEYMKLQFKFDGSEVDGSEEEENIDPNLVLRHQTLLFFEFGIIEHIERELEERGIDIELQQKNYVARILAYLMNFEGPLSTIRNEYKYLTKYHKTPPKNQNPFNPTAIKEIKKILTEFELDIKRLE
jgi:hypothetical protein